MASVSDSSKLLMIYEGPGVGSLCAEYAKASIKEHLQVENFQLLRSDLSTIFHNRVSKDAILILPGGNAIFQLYAPAPYELMSLGDKFQKFVNEGGCIHATCAGAITLSPSLICDFNRFSKKAFTTTRKHQELPVKLLDSIAVAPLYFEEGKEHVKGDTLRYSSVKLVDNEIFPESLRGRSVSFFDYDSSGWEKCNAIGRDIILGCYENSLDSDTSAILYRDYGQNRGKVWAQGAHLEFQIKDIIPSTQLLLTEEQQRLREELFCHSFRILGL